MMSNNDNTDMDLPTLHHDGDEMSFVAIYRLIVAILCIAILMTGVMIAIQTQQRHQTYQQLSRLKRDLVHLKVEEGRLLIEQQTFSGTPQVARRAVGELGMFYPSEKQRQIVSVSARDEP